MRTGVYIDLPSLRNTISRSEDGRFIWPTPYSEYLNVSGKLTEGLSKAFCGSSLPEVVRAAAASVVGPVIVDAERAAKCAIDIHHAREQEMELRFDRQVSPVHAFITAADPLPAAKLAISHFFPSPLAPASTWQKLKAPAARAVTACMMRLRPSTGRMDMQNRCMLLDEFIESSGAHPLLLREERWRLPDSVSIAGEIPDLTDLAGSLVEATLRDRGYDAQLARRARFVTESFADERLRDAFTLAEGVRRSSLLNHAGDILVGATSNEFGRLLNWQYQRSGAKVWRFAHGGDRAFFFDPIWSLLEFPYVDRYHVFGGSEAKRWQNRYQAKPDFISCGGRTEFVSFGSSRHRKWWEEGIKRKSRRRTRGKPRVIFCAGSFLGEAVMVPLNFKPPDPIIADTASHIIRTLVDQGYDVHIKPHPKGLIASNNWYDHLGVKIIQGAFDPVGLDADCYVFDFAGSAFFDALASEKGVVLVDTAIRQWDSNGRADMKKRCEIVPAIFDEDNRIRADEDLLLAAVARASDSRGCSEKFARQHFFPSVERQHFEF